MTAYPWTTRPWKPAVAETDAQAAPLPMVPGVARALTPLVRRILAPNPGMMTGPGTNTYLVGIDEIAVIDPGPDDPGHLDAIAGCGGDRIRWILCTHTHPDHSPGAAGLKARTGAQVLAYEDRDGLVCDAHLVDGDGVDATEFRLAAVHTPGHASNHLCFLLGQERLLFSGDHVMDGSTVVISPPDGDMAAYLGSLQRLLDIRPRLRAIAPAHGRVIDDPVAVVAGYIAHRVEREQQILDVLTTEPQAVDALVACIYSDVDPRLHPVAARSVWAHLRKLSNEGRVVSDDVSDINASWAIP